MEIGIVGLPNVGKSTLFNALTSGHAASSNYPFTTIEPNVGVVLVPDARLKRLQTIFSSKKLMPATMKFVDIAGLVKGASEGAGLGNKFLNNIREVDAIVQVIRLFKDPDVVHTLGAVDPLRDIEVIETELILSDLQAVEKQLEKIGKAVRAGDKDAKAQHEMLEKLRALLNEGKTARQSGYSEEELKPLFLLTAKPTLYLGNVDETANPENELWAQKLSNYARDRGAECLTICSKLESELAQMESEDDKKMFREELGMQETGLERLIRQSYALLKQQTFLTAGEQEIHAWTIPVGASAVEAAGKIHSDIAKGFIKADVYKYKDIDELGSEKAVAEKGLKRAEGRDYVMQEGDVVYFHFR